jgi:hypothetical protein
MTAPGSYRRKKGLWIFPPVVAVSTMLPALLVAGALGGVAAVGLAAPASAYHGGCYKDTYRNCSYAPLSLATGNDSPADDAAYGTTPDQYFAYYVTHDDDAPEFRIMDFPTLKGQALWACQLRTNGLRGIDAVYALQNAAGYTFDQAKAITSAAATIYCPWNLPPEARPAPSPG